MISNIGKRIKLLSIIYCSVIDLVCCVLCILFWKEIGATLAVIAITMCIIQTSVISLLIYGYGQLISNSDKQLRLLRISAELLLVDHQDYPRFDEYANEIIHIEDDE